MDHTDQTFVATNHGKYIFLGQSRINSRPSSNFQNYRQSDQNLLRPLKGRKGLSAATLCGGSSFPMQQSPLFITSQSTAHICRAFYFETERTHVVAILILHREKVRKHLKRWKNCTCYQHQLLKQNPDSKIVVIISPTFHLFRNQHRRLFFR